MKTGTHLKMRAGHSDLEFARELLVNVNRSTNACPFV